LPVSSIDGWSPPDDFFHAPQLGIAAPLPLPAATSFQVWSCGLCGGYSPMDAMVANKLG